MEIILRLMRRVFWLLCRILPVKKNKIVFVSYYGRGYCDNPKYVAEALLQSGKAIEYVWVLAKGIRNDAPDGFRTCIMNSFSYIYHMSTAGIWVDNARKYYCLKKKNQYYIQCWHGSFGLKKIEKDALDKLEPDYIKMATRDARYTDLMVSNSKTLSELYRSAFWYDHGEILECGLPRNDKLFNYSEGDVDRIKAVLGVDGSRKLALYAPTFRQNKRLDIYDIDYKRCAQALKARYGGEWTVLVRLHPNVYKLAGNLEFDGVYAIDASKYHDIQELYIISDIALTDYSSVMFDFSIMQRPCFLYANDIEEYRKERDYFIEIDSLPYPLAKNNDELDLLIRNFDEKEYYENVKAFSEYHGFCDDGKASFAVAEWIIKKMDK